MDCAFDEFGINFLDTAEMYPVPTRAETQGATDRTIAEWLKKRGASRRDEVVLASKVAGYSDRITWLRESGKGTRVRRADLVESVESSLLRLGTDRIDLLQIHWPDRYVPLFGEDGYRASKEREGDVGFEEQLDALRSLVEQGKVREVGVSNETPYGVCRFDELHRREGYPKMVSVQNSYSMLVRSEFESGGLSEACSPRNADVGLLAYSPLAGGILTGKYAAGGADTVKSGGSRNPKARLNLFPGFMDRYKKSTAVEAVKLYGDVAASHGLTPTELSLAWCYTRPWVASTIIGATSLPQLRENVRAWGLVGDGRFTEQVEADVDAVYRRYRDPSKTG